MLDIQQKDNGKKGSFYIELDDEMVAEMTYVWVGKSRIIIDHTEVDEKLKGKNAGKQMVAKAVEFAREKEIKILPLCPFAKNVLQKVKSYSDVL